MTRCRTAGDHRIPPITMVLRKDQIEASLQEEKKLIEDGTLKEDNPLDDSEAFVKLCEACRRGDLKTCQEMITEGANINARDRSDYTPLILVCDLTHTCLRHCFLTPQGKASLCGHFDVVRMLLESGALCERDTFQGERCIYNALTDRIRNLLLSYDYSKSTDPLQPFASHITSILTREHPQTSDILVAAAGESFRLHKFILAARSPYFARKLSIAPDTKSWKLPSAIPPQAFKLAIKHIYLSELPSDIGPGAGFSEDEVLEGIDKISRQLEIVSLWNSILESGDRRLARQRRTDEIERGRNQLEAWFLDNVLKHRVVIDTAKVDNVRWERNNSIFADVLLRVDEFDEALETEIPLVEGLQGEELDTRTAIPIGPLVQASRSPSRNQESRKSILFPVHRAMLLKSDYFMTMFSSAFREAQNKEFLQIISLDCSPEVLEVVLRFLYTEKTDFHFDIAIDVLFAADALFIEKLKQKAAMIISTIGSGSMSQIPTSLDAAATSQPEQEEVDIYDVVRAAWLTRVPRLEEFGARYLAYRLVRIFLSNPFMFALDSSSKKLATRRTSASATYSLTLVLGLKKQC